MASTWIETPSFYSKLKNICRKSNLPNLSLEDQLELFPKMVNTIGHKDFIPQMIQYIEELNLPEEERGTYAPIRVRMGGWFAAASDTQPWVAEFLANWIKTQPFLPDTYAIEEHTIGAIHLISEEDGPFQIILKTVLKP